MTSTTFTTSIDTPAPDPSKHVKFTQGMVLGVDDFTQEFAYLSGRDQWLARDAIGYGTVCGLHVALDSADFNRISVSPGTAINPRGQLIRVNTRQCARLDAWLALSDTVDRMNQLGISATGDLTAYVTLCYRDCPTDEIPVPGEPCRCDTDTMAASRIMDDFRLELTLTPPPQLEEDALRDLIDWLRKIEVADFEPTRADLDAFLQSIRDAMGSITSPPESPPPDYFYGSPPASIRIPRNATCQWMRAAMRLWVTELRPIWQAQCAPRPTSSDPCGCHGTGAQPDDMACNCILLAAITITRGSGGITGAVIDEEHRPFLVHLRMLEELLLCGPCCGSGCGNSRTFATVFPVDAHTLRIWVHHPITLDLPAQAVSLELNDATITDFTITALGGNFFDLELSSSPAETIPAGTSIELVFDASLIQQIDGRDLAVAIREDGYCYPDYIEPRLQVFGASGLDVVNLAGDVVGAPAQNQLESIQGDPLDLAALSDGQVLGYDGGIWHPVTLSAAANVPQPGAATPQPDAATGSPGTSDRFSREDHVHPAVAVPQPAIAIPLPDAGAGAVGASANYAREDHVHPAVAVPQPATAIPLPDAGAGVVGASANYAREDHVHPVQEITGDFVEHPAGAGEYFIVAAGILHNPGSEVVPSYNDLTVVSTEGETVLLTFNGYVQPPSASGAFYIVKGTSLGETEAMFHVTGFEAAGFRIKVPFDPVSELQTPSSFMIEVSMFFSP